MPPSLLGRARERAAQRRGRLEVLAAAEGHAIELEPSPIRARRRVTTATDAAKPTSPSGAVLVVGEDGEASALLRAAAEADGLPVLRARTLEEARRLVEQERPGVVFMPRTLGGEDCLGACARLRGAVDGHGRAVPLVIYGRGAEIEPEAGRAAGISAWLECPFSPQYARARMRAWLLRMPLRWDRAEQPRDEPERDRVVRALGLVGTPPEERFDRYTRLARALFRVPMAWVNLVVGDLQFSKSRPPGLAAELPRDASLCAHTILGEGVLEIPDARFDDRAADNPTVVGEPHIRFYAGVPLRHRGHRVGTLCIGDVRPRRLDDALRVHLEELGRLVEEELERSRTT